MHLYKIGLVIGRFQMFHIGHKRMIDSALKLCDKVVVFVGSSQESGTIKNPFSFEQRKLTLEKVYQNDSHIIILPLPDVGVGNNESWGKYVLETFKENLGCYPDLYVTGCEKDRGSWFTDELAPDMDELRLSRKVKNISASLCREYLLSNNFQKWKESVPIALYDNYESYKEQLLTVYKEIIKNDK